MQCRTCLEAAKKGFSCKHVHAVLSYSQHDGDMELLDLENEVREFVLEKDEGEYDDEEEPIPPSTEVSFCSIFSSQQ